jgi:phage gp36-like protein
MPYATPARYISQFGLDETTQLLADEQNLLTSQLLLDALAVANDNGYWTGEPTDAEQAAALAAKDRFERKLVTISNFMDGYLRAAVTLPLAATDANAGTLEECCMALARCGLADDADNATDRMDKCCDQWRSWLKDVQAGRVTLIGAAGLAVPGSGRVKTGQAASSYAWAGFPPVRRF